MVQQAKNLAAASQVTVLMRVHSPAQSSGLEVLHVYNGKNKNYYRDEREKKESGVATAAARVQSLAWPGHFHMLQEQPLKKKKKKKKKELRDLAFELSLTATKKKPYPILSLEPFTREVPATIPGVSPVKKPR